MFQDELYKVTLGTSLMLKFWQKMFVFQLVAMLIAITPSFGQSWGNNYDGSGDNAGNGSNSGDSIDFDQMERDELAQNAQRIMEDAKLQQDDPEAYERKKKMQESGILGADGKINLNPATSQSGIQGQTVLEFAKENKLTIGGKSAEEILKDKEIAYCGTVNDKCNRKTHVCWRCTVTDDQLVGRKKHELGICLEGDYNSTSKEAGKRCEQFSKDETEMFTVVWRWTARPSPDGFLAVDKSKLFWFLTTHDNEDERTFTGKGPDGKEHKYILAYDQNNPTLRYADGGNADGCEVLPIKLNKLSRCFFCPLAQVIFDTANEVAGMSLGMFGKSFQNLILVAFAVWLAFASLNIVFTYTKQDASKYVTSIIKQGGKFLFAYFLLVYYDDLFRLFISPILVTGLEMGDKIKSIDISATVNCENSSSGGLFASGGLWCKIEQFLTNVQQQLAVMQAIGTTLLCVGGNTLSFKDLIKGHAMDGVRCLALGLILFIFGLLLTVSFAFYFLDALIQLCILGAMLPLMIAGWPFKVTASYATTGLKMVLNTAFTMFFTGFVISVELGLINSALEFINSEKNVGNNSGVGLNGLFNALNNQNIDDVYDLVNVGTKGFLLIIFAAFFGFKFVAQVPKLANKMAQGVSLGISSKVGTMMASSAKGVAMKATKPFRDMASNKWHQGGGLIGRVSKVGMLPGALIKGGNALAHKAGMKNTWVDKFQANMAKKASDYANKAQDASLKGGMMNRLKEKFYGGMSKRAQATSEHGVIGGVSSRISDKSKQIHREYAASEKYNDARQKQEAALRKKHGGDE